jgi:hypothetical protein
VRHQSQNSEQCNHNVGAPGNVEEDPERTMGILLSLTTRPAAHPTAAAEPCNENPTLAYLQDRCTPSPVAI